MFKKTLAAAAILAAFGSAAYAADVQLYGRIDLGLQYTHTDMDLPGVDSNDTFEMSNGTYTGNRLGLKGTEELGNGWKVAFVLENGFKADSGELKTSGSIFDREASLQLISDTFGTFAFGRQSSFFNDGGTFGIGGRLSPFGTGWGDVGGQGYLWGSNASLRWDNMVVYATPSFAGFKLYAEYSFGDSDTETGAQEGKASTDRYYAIGATYDNGPLALTAIVDSINRNSKKPDNAGAKYDVKDMVRAAIGGSYDFGFVKPYLSVAYVKDGSLDDMAGMYEGFSFQEGAETINLYDDVIDALYWDAWSVALGADVPAFGGAFHGVVGYMDGSADRDAYGDLGGDIDITRWMIGLGYDYQLSKRTTVYGVAGYSKDKFEMDGVSGDWSPSVSQVSVGMVHYF